jgi:predicted methyltransferase
MATDLLHQAHSCAVLNAAKASPSEFRATSGAQRSVDKHRHPGEILGVYPIRSRSENVENRLSKILLPPDELMRF